MIVLIVVVFCVCLSPPVLWAVHQQHAVRDRRPLPSSGLPDGGPGLLPGDPTPAVGDERFCGDNIHLCATRQLCHEEATVLLTDATFLVVVLIKCFGQKCDFFFLIVQHRDIFHRVHRHPSSRMCHFHLPSYPRNFCF